MIFRVFLSLILLLTACRTVQKASSSSDIARSDTESSKYNREIVTEYIVRDSLSGKPVIVNVMPPNSGNSQGGQPVIITQKEPYIIRQTIRESGEQQAEKTETVKEDSKEKEAGVPMLLQIAAVVFAAAFLLIALVLLIRR